MRGLFRFFYAVFCIPLGWVIRFKRRKAQGLDLLKSESAPTSTAPVYWFHAASVGELEGLSPLIEEAAKAGKNTILTIFSISAEGALQKLAATLTERGTRPVAWGFSPLEGQWGVALDRYKPARFITVKYEAWPELWMSLAERKIPLVIVGACLRKSLVTAKKLCEAMCGKLPHLMLLPHNDRDQRGLKSEFDESPTLSIRIMGDPRWDRVFQRARRPGPRAQKIIRDLIDAPKSWGMLGSVWIEDLYFLEPVFRRWEGTVVVPHDVSPANVARMAEYIRSCGVTVAVMSKDGLGVITSERHCVIVDETGVLTEIYAASVWSYVGGGHGAGVHSTIEPAAYGLIVGIGPNGSELFPEIIDLKNSYQLDILRDHDDVMRWIKKINDLNVLIEDRKGFAFAAAAHQGSSQKILGAVEKVI